MLILVVLHLAAHPNRRRHTWLGTDYITETAIVCRVPKSPVFQENIIDRQQVCEKLINLGKKDKVAIT
jgi:hypothetical protein